LEDISIEKIKKRIVQNIDYNVNPLLDSDVNPLFGSNSRPSLNSGLTLRERLIAFGLRHKYIILKIPLLNKAAKKIYSLAKRNLSLNQMIKRSIRKIPLFGFLAWWVYKIGKTPSNIVAIIKQVDSQKEEMWNLGNKALRTEEITQAIIKQVDSQKEEMRNLDNKAQRTEEITQAIIKQVDSQKEEMRNLDNKALRTEEITQAIIKQVDSQKEEMRNLDNKAQRTEEITQAIIKQVDSQKEEMRNLDNKAQRTEEITQAIIKQVDSQKEGMRNLGQINPRIDLKDVYLSRGSLGDGSYLSRAFAKGVLPDDIELDKTNEDVFYYALENLFRGEVSEIEKRQSIYLPYIVEANSQSTGTYFLDLGCGRGEFLGLLSEHNIIAKGIDTNQFTIDILKRQGLDVFQSDAHDFLAGLEDSTLKGITMFQVVEHLNYEYLKSLLVLSFNKIASDGIIILESVNPYCIVALGAFYLDPTHLKPLSPDLLKFLLEWYGFTDVQIVYSNPTQESLCLTHIIMNYQTYAVIGRKQTHAEK
jgi:SAM-dependent methyltransferase